jgi:hypothetical protein
LTMMTLDRQSGMKTRHRSHSPSSDSTYADPRPSVSISIDWLP